MKLDGAVFVVTGGASGIGEATVRMAVANGAKAAIWDLQDKARGASKTLVEELGADKVCFSKVNVTAEADVDAALEATVAKFGRVDVCVNCAGLGHAAPTVNKKHEPYPIGKWNRIIQICLVGSFLTGSKCAAQMSKNEPNKDGERGLVVNISSVAAFDGQNGQSAYSAAKMGLVGMTLPMARDMGRIGIRVNTICPGIIDTPLTGNVKPVEDRDPDKIKNRVMKGLLTSQVFPNRRHGNPAELANTVKFLAETAFMNGETIRCDAGVRMPKL